MQLNHFNGHYAAGGIVRVFKKTVDDLSRFFVSIFKDTLYNRGRNLLKQINGVIDKKVVHEPFNFPVGEQLDKLRLTVCVKIGKNIG